MKYYRLSRHSFVRKIESVGFIYNQRTKQNVTFSSSGIVFLSVLLRKAQSLNLLIESVSKHFVNVSKMDLATDVEEFFDSLVDQMFLVCAETEDDCDQMDYDLELMSISELQEDDFEDCIEKPYLQSCQIEVTNKCNERCVHCYIPYSKKNIEMPYDGVVELLKQLKGLGTLKLTLSGGEFFTHSRALDILRKVRELDFSYRILSNVIALNAECLEVVKDTNPRSVQVSLYSMDPDIHDKITRVSGSCEKTKEAIKLLRQNGIPVEISCPVMKDNYKSYKDVLNFAKNLGCSAHTDLMLLSAYDFSKQNVAGRLDSVAIMSLLEEMAQSGDDSLLRSFDEEDKTKMEWERESLCLVGRKELCVDADGNAFPCSGGQAIVCGNALEQPLEDIWLRSPKLNELRSLTNAAISQCYNCIASSFCHVCIVYNYNESGGNYLDVPARYCLISHLKLLYAKTRQMEKMYYTLAKLRDYAKDDVRIDAGKGMLYIYGTGTLIYKINIASKNYKKISPLDLQNVKCVFWEFFEKDLQIKVTEFFKLKKEIRLVQKKVAIFEDFV